MDGLTQQGSSGNSQGTRAIEFERVTFRGNHSVTNMPWTPCNASEQLSAYRPRPASSLLAPRWLRRLGTLAT